MTKEATAIGNAVLKAGETLPPGCKVIIEVMRDEAFVSVADAAGNAMEFETGGVCSKAIANAAKAAIRAA